MIFFDTLFRVKGNTPKILVVFSRVDFSHRRMLEGILNYVRDKCLSGWEIQLDQRDIYHQDPTAHITGEFTGVIAAVATAADRRKFLRMGLPTVLFEPTLAHMDRAHRPQNVITFFNDHAAEGRAAAEYYLERGFKSFAFVGTPVPTAWSSARQEGFVSTLRHYGIKPLIYPRPKAEIGSDFSREVPLLVKWLKQLPGQTALQAAHDERALQVLSAARRAGLIVPENLAILGVDDDELLCTTAAVSLSSIPVAAEEAGWRMAEALNALFRNQPYPRVVRTCHTRVITRSSTSSFAISDPIVVKAISFIEKNLHQPLRVEQLAAAANCSVRTLQLKMLRELRRTPLDEIMLLRRTQAIKLIKETDRPIGEIAEQCGYCSISHLTARIKAATGLTPLALRKS